MKKGRDPEALRIEAYLIDRFERTEVEVFHMLNHATGENVYLLTRELRSWCLRTPRPVVRVPIDPVVLRRIIDDNAINVDRMLALTEEDRQEPIVLARFGTSTPPVVTPADGRHRYFRAAVEGERALPAWIVEEREWRRFEIFGPQVSHAELRATPTETSQMRGGYR